MSGDRLAQIEANFRERRSRGITSTWFLVDDVLALVEIAEAARDMADADCDGYLAGAPFYGKLRSALARLDSGAAEENT